MPEGAENIEMPVKEKLVEVAAETKETVQEMARGDFSDLWAVFGEYIMPAVSALLILIIGYFAARFFSRVISKPVKSRVDETVGGFVGKLVFYSIMAFTLIAILARFGVSVASFAAVVAAAGFAIGLAFQGTLSNFAAGILLLVFRPFKVGDLVIIAGELGIVEEIDLFTTTYHTYDYRRIIVPNSNITTSTIENLTYYRERRVDIAVGVEYPANIQKTREALKSACDSLEEKMLKVGPRSGYQVYLNDLGDSSVNWVVRFWAKTSDYWEVKESLTEAIKNSLDEAGIGIPFPQMDVHLDVANVDEAKLRVAGGA